MSETVRPVDPVAATIRTETSIAVTAAEVWATVRDVGAVHQRLAPGFVVNTRLEEGARVVSFANGMVVKERILDVDDDAMRLVYAAVGGRATYHRAMIQVVPDGQSSRLIWITDVLPVDLKGQIGAMMEQGSAVMKKTLESAAAPRA